MRHLAARSHGGHGVGLGVDEGRGVVAWLRCRDATACVLEGGDGVVVVFTPFHLHFGEGRIIKQRRFLILLAGTILVEVIEHRLLLSASYLRHNLLV